MIKLEDINKNTCSLNRMKSSMPQEEFIYFCRLIAQKFQ